MLIDSSNNETTMLVYVIREDEVYKFVYLRLQWKVNKKLIKNRV